MKTVEIGRNWGEREREKREEENKMKLTAFLLGLDSYTSKRSFRLIEHLS